jgi:hypothetical protein
VQVEKKKPGKEKKRKEKDSYIPNLIRKSRKKKEKEKRFVFARQIDSSMRREKKEGEISVVKRSQYVSASLSDY